MTATKLWNWQFGLLFYFLFMVQPGFAQDTHIHQHKTEGTIEFGNDKITILLNYHHQAAISSMRVNGQEVIQDHAGVYSYIRTKGKRYSTLQLLSEPHLKIWGNRVVMTDIRYGDSAYTIREKWTFTIRKNEIQMGIDRILPKKITAEQAGLPVFKFSDIHTWEGAYQDYGGLAWFYLFDKKRDTYGVYSRSSQFWNSKTGNGLTVQVLNATHQVAMDYSRTKNDNLMFNILVSPTNDITYRFDSLTHRRAYVRDTEDIWAPVILAAGKSHQDLLLSDFDFNEKYGRGNLKGIHQEQVSAVLNTIARIGVIGKNHFGGNSWHTPYGPLCLHEQYIAQLGLGINDPYYLKGYQECLDYYRDNALQPDGRVLPRWAYSNEDAMPNHFTDKGFYEAQWGYLLDANPDFVTNVAELYDQTGNLSWVKTHQISCEKALDWILKRDQNNNGLVEMVCDSHTQKKGSDWLDIIWASYENAFVNAKLYHALLLWADIERQLGNPIKQNQYNSFAEKLKISFNKSTSDGGFWDPEKNCYIHWREKDGSIHGNNMVIPVNFMAIAYGICDNRERSELILDTIEAQMRKENLFFWPICLYSYAPGEGNDWQFPFPNYENGDLFLSWGSLGIQAYASYKPELALKYVKNVLDQYARDGLAFQRYGRIKQDGLGDDILSGNSLSIVGLYQSIYGINPLYNRFYLHPHITRELDGTLLTYRYRGQTLTIILQEGHYEISNPQFKVSSSRDFGVFYKGNQIQYFKGDSKTSSLEITTGPKTRLSLSIDKWEENNRLFTQSVSNKDSGSFSYQVSGLKVNQPYFLSINHKPFKKISSDAFGNLEFLYTNSQSVTTFAITDR